MVKNVKEVKSIGGILFRYSNANPKYLIIKHNKLDDHWGFPKGRIEKEETSFETLKREIFEETGIKKFKVIKSLKFRTNYSFTFKKQKIEKSVVYFLLETKEKKIRLSKEHDDYKWGNFEGILKLLNIDDLKQILVEANSEIFKPKTKKEVIIASYPKAGRTWITLLISRIIQKKYDFNENCVINIEKMSQLIMNLPIFRVSHEEDLIDKKNISYQEFRIKYSGKKVLLIARDPRDIVVSYYFHEKRRKQRYSGSLSDFLDKKRGGFQSIIRYYNLWSSMKKYLKNIMIIRYEDFKKDPKKEVKKVLKFIGIFNVDEKIIDEAIKFSSFNNMKKMEMENRFNVNRLKSGNKRDIESYKVRRGIVGGYKNYLNEKDIEKLNNKMKHLSRIYGYYNHNIDKSI